MTKRTAMQLLMAAVLLSQTATQSALAEPASEKKARPRLDLAFCIDTTSSMGGEIEMVKTKTKELVAKLSTGKPAPDVRVGLVAYRDQGDDYVTKVFPFSDDIDKVVKDISSLRAEGGGDAPEAVDCGLHAAVHDLNWDKDPHASKLLFLIGDAGPHGDKQDKFDWRKESREAIASGIQINTIACGNLSMDTSANGANVFKTVAQLTDGKFDTLAYRQQVVDASGRRSTIVTAGGASYAVRAEDKDWKSAALSKSLVALPAAPASAAVASAYPSRSRIFAAGGAAPALMGATNGTISRDDSNLDAMLFSAAKTKAGKDLKVSY